MLFAKKSYFCDVITSVKKKSKKRTLNSPPPPKILLWGVGSNKKIISSRQNEGVGSAKRCYLIIWWRGRGIGQKMILAYPNILQSQKLKRNAFTLYITLYILKFNLHLNKHYCKDTLYKFQTNDYAEIETYSNLCDLILELFRDKLKFIKDCLLKTKRKNGKMFL